MIVFSNNISLESFYGSYQYTRKFCYNAGYVDISFSEISLFLFFTYPVEWGAGFLTKLI